jgi:uncharacterized cofD-like protein
VRVTGVGGGHGLAATLKAARRYADEVDAVVTVADDGGSSGRLTRELGIPPPGDIRNCLVALAQDEALADVYQHRFQSGALTGHTVGNLLIAALTEKTGDFAVAVAEAGRMLRVSGRVHPATTDLVSMGARVEGGVIEGQVAVAQTSAPIQVVYLEPSDPMANPKAVEAVLGADQVVLGPGSLFTSLIATLLVPGIRKALNETSATRVFVCNARMQKGETQGLDASSHLEALFAHVGPYSVDAVVVQKPVLSVDGVEVDVAALEALGLRVVEADVVSPDGAHDPERLQPVLASLS